MNVSDISAEMKERIIADIKEGKLAKSKIAKKYDIGMIYLALIVGEAGMSLWRTYASAPRGTIKVRKDGTISILAAIPTELGLEPGEFVCVTVHEKTPDMLLKIERI